MTRGTCLHQAPIMTTRDECAQEVDLLLLSRDLSPVRPDVWRGIESQDGVRLHVHRLTGTRHPDDANRYETIVRARNAGKHLGLAPWVMLLDDDVVLDSSCVARLVDGLRVRPDFAAFGADSAGEMAGGRQHWDYPRHVGMAATLFRREQLKTITFRWEPGKCECRCCCEDLHRAGIGIGYLPGAQAWHRPDPRQHAESAASGAPPPSEGAARPLLPGRILAAFDRHHLRLFTRRFLGSLRRSGNSETVTAVVAGLYPSELRVLAAMPGVEVVVAPNDGHPAYRRLRDFQSAIARWPEETPVAYWDAGDVVFQGRIAPLWDLVRADPERLLAVREAIELATSTVALDWVETIRDPEARRRALDLLSVRPVLNSGFAAGTVRSMRRYLQGAERLQNSAALHGSTDWGDQTAMNLYCHSNPDTWQEIPSAWNYVLVGLGPKHYQVGFDGQTQRLDGEPLHVVHGAGGTLRPWDLHHLTA
jgi:hypothetical protein